MKENNLIEKNDIMDTQKKVYKKLIEKNDGLEYYMVYENGESHLEVNLIQPSWNELSYCDRMPRLGF